MSLYWTNITDVLMRRDTDIDTQGEGHGITKAEIGMMMHLQVKEHQGLLANTRS